MDHYEIDGVVGEGTHGIVLKATQIDTQEPVALKKLPLKSIEEGMSVQVFREIQSLRQLSDCEQIVKLRDVFAHCLGFVLAFDFMPSDLGQLIKSGISVAMSKTYNLQLLRGVSFMHSLSIIHRDIKPANLLISDQGMLKIADFSLARLHLKNGSGKTFLAVASST